MQALPLACSSLTWCPLLARPRFTLAPFLHFRKRAEFITKQGLNRALHAVVTQVIFAEWVNEGANEWELLIQPYVWRWILIHCANDSLLASLSSGPLPSSSKETRAPLSRSWWVVVSPWGSWWLQVSETLRTQQPSLLRSMLLRHQAMSIFFHPVRPKKRAPSRGQHCQVKVEVNAKQDRSANLGKEGGGSWLLCQC